MLAVITVCTAAGAWHWLTDPVTPQVSFTQSLWNHPFFAIASISLGIKNHIQNNNLCNTIIVYSYFIYFGNS